MKKIGIIMGSDSDLPIAEKAAEKLAEYGIAYEAHVYSAHRTPEEAVKFAKDARANGFGALIALAGKAACGAALSAFSKGAGGGRGLAAVGECEEQRGTFAVGSAVVRRGAGQRTADAGPVSGAKPAHRVGGYGTTDGYLPAVLAAAA